MPEYTYRCPDPDCYRYVTTTRSIRRVTPTILISKCPGCGQQQWYKRVYHPPHIGPGTSGKTPPR